MSKIRLQTLARNVATATEIVKNVAKIALITYLAFAAFDGRRRDDEADAARAALREQLKAVAQRVDGIAPNANVAPRADERIGLYCRDGVCQPLGVVPDVAQEGGAR